MSTDPWADEHPLVREAIEKCPPRYWTRPTPGAPHLLDACLKMAVVLGFKPMPWQALVWRIATEMNPKTRRPRFRFVTVLLPRQNGKTAWELTLMALRLVRPWLQVVYAGQTGAAGRERMLETFMPRLERCELVDGLSLKYRKAPWPDIKCGISGTRVSTWGGSESSNHGDTLDLALCDEVWRHYDDVLDQSLVPTLKTRQSGQMIDVSTAGTERSVYLLQRVEDGRAGEDPRTAYIEYSAPDNSDIEDPAVAAACNPGLGYVLDMAEIDADRRRLSESAFKRTNLNIFVPSEEPWPIPREQWTQIKHPQSTPSGGIVIALDAEPTHRISAYAVACDSAGRAQMVDEFNLATVAVEAGEDEDGEDGDADRAAAGLADWCVRVAKANADVRAFALTDSGGLAGARDKIERAVGKHKVIWYTKSERCAAAGFLLDQVVTGRIALEQYGHACAFDRALAAATRWPRHGDRAWEFQRHTPQDGDISALVALSLAVHAATGVEAPKPRRARFW